MLTVNRTVAHSTSQGDLMTTISDYVGPTQVDHCSFLVRTGKLEEAVSFFVEQLLWIEDGPRVSGDWGTAVFVRQKNTNARIQLNEFLARPEDIVTCTDAEHLAIAVMITSARAAAEAIIVWAVERGLGDGHSYEPANKEETKWFVYLPEVFAFALEIIQVKAFRTS